MVSLTIDNENIARRLLNIAAKHQTSVEAVLDDILRHYEAGSNYIGAALSDLLAYPVIESIDYEDESALYAEFDAAFQGQPPLSEAIIAERKQGP
jgi:plasmid stability protein